MAERITRVILEADIAKFEENLKRAKNATKDLKDEGDKLAETHRAMTTLGTAAIALGAAAAAGVGVAVAKFAEFDQQMSYVQAATHETADNMGLLRQAALDAGASTVFSATEAAQAVEELSKAGISTADILGGGLTGAMDLAAAGGLGVARAAEISATALQQFQLDGTQASHVADVLAAGAGKAMGSVDDLAQGLKFVGPIAASMGVSIEETTGTLALFAQQGIIGEQAGTSLRGMLSSLTSPSALARKEIDRLGISLYDNAGNFIGLEHAAGQLASAYSGMTGEARDASLGLIFGNQQITAATALYQAGASGVAKWTEAVNDSGYAADTAAMRLDNLKGDWEAFTGALDTAFITMGSGANGPLRSLVQGLTDLVDGFNGLPDWAQQAAFGVGLLTAGIGLVGGAVLVAIPKIAELKIAMATLAPQAATARAGLSRFASFLTGPWGIALVAAAAGLTLLEHGLDAAAASSEEMQNSLVTAKSAQEIFDKAGQGSQLKYWSDTAAGLKDLGGVLDQSAAQWENLWLRLTPTGAETSKMERTLASIGDELGTLAQQDLPSAQKAFAMMADESDGTERQLWALLSLMPAYKDALTTAATRQGLTADKQTLINLALGNTPDVAVPATSAMDDIAAAADAAAGDLEDMKLALDGVAGKAMEMAEAKDAALSSINALTEAAKAEGAELNGSNDASIRYRDSLRDVETAHRDSAESIIQNTGSLTDAQAEWEKGREAVINMMTAKGMDREEAIRWADQQLGSASEVKASIDAVYRAWLNLPENKHTKYQVEHAEALKRLEETRKAVERIPGYRRITLETVTYGNRTASASGYDGNYQGGVYAAGVKQFYQGGFASGIYASVQGGIRDRDRIFAEKDKGVPWETYISGRMADRDRNIGIWQATGSLLGVGSQQSATPVAPAPMVGSLTLQSSGDVKRDLEEVNFHLRSYARGGRR